MSLHDALAVEIQRLLSQSPLRQDELAELTGFTQGAISNWKTGRRRPTIETSQQLADALGMQVVVSLAPKGDPGAAIMRLAGGIWQQEQAFELVELLEQVIPNLQEHELAMLTAMIRGVRDNADMRLAMTPAEERASLDEED